MPKGRYWTTQDLEYLSNKVGILNHEQLSKGLRRTVLAIKQKQTRKGIRFIDNVYTCTLLSKELGRSRRRIKVWYDRGWLKGQRATWSWCYGKTPLLFDEDDIVAFLREHHDLFNPREIPNRYFANIVIESKKIITYAG